MTLTDDERRKARIELAAFPTAIRNPMLQAGITSLEEVRERARSGEMGFMDMHNVSHGRVKEILRILGEIGTTPHCVTCQCWRSGE